MQAYIDLDAPKRRQHSRRVNAVNKDAGTQRTRAASISQRVSTPGQFQGGTGVEAQNAHADALTPRWRSHQPTSRPFIAVRQLSNAHPKGLRRQLPRKARQVINRDRRRHDGANQQQWLDAIRRRQKSAMARRPL
jgi:hypothetical protein